VLAHPVPLAYCVPGIRTATVLTDGLIEALEYDELAAVIAHERTHLDQLHHLVRLAFRAWHSAIPWFPIANRAERAVITLTEMLADDGARRAVGTDALRRALERVGDAGESGAYPESSSGANPDAAMLDARLRRLGVDPSVAERRERDIRSVRAAALAASVALVMVPVVALIAILGIVP
jgi:Zn-dependent protease with chaperone function